MFPNTELVILVHRDLVHERGKAIHEDLTFWLNQVYCSDELNLSIFEYFIIQHILRSARQGVAYENYYLVHYDKLSEDKMHGEQFNNVTLKINDLRERVWTQTKDHMRTDLKPRVRVTKPVTYSAKQRQQHIKKLISKLFLKKVTNIATIDAVKTLTSTSNYPLCNKLYYLEQPDIDSTDTLKIPTNTSKANVVKFDDLPEINMRDRTDAFFDLFNKNVAADETAAQKIDVIKVSYPIKVGDRTYKITKTSRRLAGDKNHYSAQMLGRDRQLLSHIRHFMFDIDVESILKPSWEYKQWTNEYAVTKSYLVEYIGYNAGGTNPNSVVDRAVTRLCEVYHTMSVAPEDELVMEKMHFVDEQGNPMHEAQFTYLVNNGRRFDIDQNDNTDMFVPDDKEKYSATNVYYLAWNKFDEKIYRKKLLFLSEYKQKLISSWEERGCPGHEPKPNLTEEFIRNALEGFQMSRYQEQHHIRIPNRYLDVAQTFIASFSSFLRGAGFFYGVDYTDNKGERHIKNMTRHLRQYVEERINLDKYENDYIATLLIPTLCESVFLLGTTDLTVGKEKVKVGKLFALLNDIVFVKIACTKDTHRFDDVVYTIDMVVVSEEFANQDLSSFNQFYRRKFPLEKRLNREKLSSIAASEDPEKMEQLEVLFLKAHSMKKKWRLSGENVISNYHLSTNNIEEAAKYRIDNAGPVPNVNADSSTSTSSQLSDMYAAAARTLQQGIDEHKAAIESAETEELKLALMIYATKVDSNLDNFDGWYENQTNEKLESEVRYLTQLGIVDKKYAFYQFTSRTVIQGN